MLQSLRDLSKTWLFKGLMTLLVVSFGIWGVGDMFRTHPGQREIARIGKKKIAVQDLELQFQLSLPEAKKVFGPDLTPAKAREIGVLDRTLNVMIDEATFDIASAKLGLKLSHAVTFRWIAAIPELRGPDGKFNTRVWNELIGKTGLGEELFLDQETRRIVRDILVQALVSNAQPPKLVIDNLYRAQGAKRLFEVVTLRNDSIASIPAPSEEDLETYYDENQDKFVAPEYRGLTVARLFADDVAKDVVVTDEDLAKAYETRKSSLNLPETRDLVQIVFQDEAKARAFQSALPKPSSLEVVAKSKNLTAVPLAKIDEKAILPELFATVFSLSEGEVSEPIKSGLGWHVVQVKKIYPGGVPSFEQIKKTLRETLQEERVGDAVAKAVNQLDDSLAEGKSLEDIADALKLRLVRFASMDAQGRAPDGTLVREIPAPREKILETAFGLEAEETSQVLDDRQGNYFVVRADQISPSHVLPLAEVKEKVQAGWRAQKQAAAAAIEAETMAKNIREGAKPTSFAARPGVEVRLSKPISILGDMDKDIPVTTLQNLFKMKRGDVLTAAAPDKQMILRLADIVPVDPQKPDPSRMKIADFLQDKLRLDILGQYDAYVHAANPVKVNAELLASLKKQGENETSAQ